MVPVRPSDFEALIVQPSDSLATGIIKTFIRLPALFYRLVAYLFTADGEISPEFEEDLCGLGCADNEGEGT